MPAREFSAKTWSLDFLSKSSSSRVPQFIILWFCNSTHREQPVHSTSIVQRLGVWENTVGAASLLTTVSTGHLAVTFLKKRCTYISLLGGVPTEHLASWHIVGWSHSRHSDQPVHTPSFVERFSVFQVSNFKFLGHCQETQLLWTCHWWTAGINMCLHCKSENVSVWSLLQKHFDSQFTTIHV